MNAAAVLFDVDGTLIDSNYLHVSAWSAAMDAVERPAPAWRIHRAIGMDSSKLLVRLLGDDADELGDRAKQVHKDEYARFASELRPFGSARDLLQAIHDRGLQVVLATSAPDDELARLREALDSEHVISHVTSSADVESAKPEPDVVQVALDRAGVPAGRAILIGDAVWDAKASERAGVPCIGLLSGGIGPGELRDAGASTVYDDAADLLAHLDESPIAGL